MQESVDLLENEETQVSLNPKYKLRILLGSMEVSYCMVLVQFFTSDKNIIHPYIKLVDAVTRIA